MTTNMTTDNDQDADTEVPAVAVPMPANDDDDDVDTFNKEDKDIDVVLSYCVGRKLSAEEIYTAFGLSKSTYYDQLSSGTLHTSDNLIRAARNLNINVIDLLLRCNVLDPHDLVEYVNVWRTMASSLFNLPL